MNSLESAISTVRRSLGLSTLPPSAWTYDQRVAYNRALSAEILRRQDDFPADQVATAARIQAKPADSLEDTSFDWGMFGDELAKNAADLNPVGSISKSLKWLVPVGALLALAFYFAPQIGAGLSNARKPAA